MAGDLKITQLPTAGTSVRAASGGAVIPNLYPGGSQQSYTARAASTTDVPVTATGSGAGRVDLVIARIDDPFYGGTVPSDVTVGPYVRLDIIQNVAAGSTDIPAGLAYPAIALARLDIPASTATITTSMITDLRVMVVPVPPAPDVDTGWLPLTALGAQWNVPINGSAATARRIGNRVYLTGTQRPNTGTIGIGTTTGLGTLPAGMFPPGGYNGWAVGWIAGNNSSPAEVSISTAGVINVTNSAILTGIKFYGLTFLTD